MINVNRRGTLDDVSSAAATPNHVARRSGPLDIAAVPT